MDIMNLLGLKKKDIFSLAIDEALALLDLQEYDNAIAILKEKALSRDPGHRRVLLHLGICHMLKGDMDLAEEILRPIAKQVRMDSESAAAQIALDKIASDRKKLQAT
ncbi:MAG: tetratricopeptide repeat protein [Planctomycetota bacterium]|jgi:thioredoxin-like negative regulator of GroEL|nr:tetratricopeptide repeat protein [Planctomycetota bacterium]